MGSVATSSLSETRLRELSKLLFGNADRLQVARAVARSSSGVFHAQELSNQLEISPPRVRAQLLAFTEAGLMRLLPRHRQIREYERLDDPFWEMIDELVKGWRAG